MAKQINLSVCMIINNDEEFIRGSLGQFKDIADEIIIADIGSTDHTANIARQEGAQVYPVDWHEDFSVVKNFLMERANGNWVLFMQPNEVIAEKHIREIPSLLDNPNAEGYLTLIDYNSESLRISSPVQALRLIRNHQENRYRYRSFECIPDELMTGVVNSNIEIVQLHDAMLSWEMNLRVMLLQQESNERPQDCYLLYMMGLMKLNQQRLEECITCFQNARSGVNTGYLFAPHLCKCLSWAYLFLEHYDKAIEILNEGIEFYPFYTDLYILRAEVFKQLNQYEDAIRDMEQCLQLRGYPNPTVPAPEISDSYTFALLGEIYEEVFDNTKSLSCYIQAYQLDSTDADLLTKIGELIETAGSEETVNELLCIALEQQDLGILLSLLNMLQRSHAYDAILSQMEAITPILGIEQTRNLEISCRLFTENTEDIQMDNCGLDIIIRYIERCWMHGHWQKAEKLLDKLNHAGFTEDASLGLYIHVHRMLMHQAPIRITLKPEMYEIAKAIHDDLLWTGQVDKAKLLLPMLLDNQTDDRCMQLAISWAKIGDIDIIRSVYLRITCDETKVAFIQKVITELLRHEYPSAAQQLRELGDIQLPEALERLLWASCMIQELQGRLTDIKNVKSIPQSEIKPEAVMPSNGLSGFYQIFCGLSGSTPAEGLTAAETHEKIGDLYMKTNKKTEAFSAYIMAAQTDPWSFDLHQKIIRLITENPGLENLMKRSDCISSNGWFTDAKDFVNFISGLKQYYDGSFKQASAFFSQAANNQKTSALFSAYAASIPLLDKRLNELQQVEQIEFDLTYLDIQACFNFILWYLPKPYLHCGDLRLFFEEKIRKLSADLRKLLCADYSIYIL